MSASARGNPWASAPRPIPAPPPPLLDLLGARWSLGAPVTGVAWNGDVAAFSLGDGSIAMARAEWDGAPRLSPREGGGVEVTPARASPPPVSRQRAHDGACLAIAPAGDGGFLTGGDDGVLALIAADGDVSRVALAPGQWFDVVASGAAGYSAGAAGRQVHVMTPDGPGPIVQLPASATAMAFDAAGGRLAVAHYRGVTIWSADRSEARLLATRGFPRSVAWSPDGAYIVCGLQENALHGWRLSDGGDLQMGGYPGQPRSVAFTADGRLLASSGAPRVICWRFDPPVAGQLPLECGLPASRMPVCRVACHPTHPLIAAGYQNGAVLLCQPGVDETLFARGSGVGQGADPADAPISALAWSADGARLAMGVAGGEIGVVSLPARMFRFPPGGRAGATPSERIAS